MACRLLAAMLLLPTCVSFISMILGWRNTPHLLRLQKVGVGVCVFGAPTELGHVYSLTSCVG